MRPQMYVKQRENGAGEFWYAVKAANGHVVATSEMYPSRTNAIRAARAFIRLIAPVQVEFTYCTGPVPPARGKGYGFVTELIR